MEGHTKVITRTTLNVSFRYRGALIMGDVISYLHLTNGTCMIAWMNGQVDYYRFSEMEAFVAGLAETKV